MEKVNNHWCQSPVDPDPVKVPLLTPLIVTDVESETGEIKTRECILEKEIDPTYGLEFSDFTLQKMLRAGIPPKSLRIGVDTRLGIDSSILDDFESRVNSNYDKLFNEVKPE